MNSENVTIVEAQASDLTRINAIIGSSLWRWRLPERVKRLALSSFCYDELDLKELSIYVIKSRNEILGVLSLDIPSDSPQKNGQDLFVHGLYIAQEHQRKGLGSKLLDFALNQAINLGLSGMVVKSQKEAIGFYQQAGFEFSRSNTGYSGYENSLRKSAA